MSLQALTIYLEYKIRCKNDYSQNTASASKYKDLAFIKK